MKTNFTNRHFIKKLLVPLFTGLLLFLVSLDARAQLGVYEFTGAGTCPVQSPGVTTPPANGSFSNISSSVIICNAWSNAYSTLEWSPSSSFDPTRYIQFGLTSAPGFGFDVTTLSFTQLTEGFQSGNQWVLRSNLDNYTTDLATGTVDIFAQTPVVTLPAAFNNIGQVTFRLYNYKAKNANTAWFVDNITVNGSIYPVPDVPANPVSNSPQCVGTGVTISFNGAPPVGETWYWQIMPNGTSTTNSASSNTAFLSGNYYLRARSTGGNNAWSLGSGSIAVVVIPNVGTPVFTAGASSTRCMAAGSFTYGATASNNTGLTYTLDPASITGGNSINATTGAVTWNAGWSGSSVITASADGCNGPTTSTHTVTITPVVTTPVFNAGPTSIRCQGAGVVTYGATASNTTGITYILDATTDAFPGNSIDPATGAVTYAAAWSGTSTITASAAGCSGPTTAVHTVTITPTVGLPVFSGGSATRCQGAGSVTYAATATNNTGITYTLDATSISGGNSINATTGEVSFVSTWFGTSTITATATGCNGPRSANRVITTNGTVATPVFALGATSTICQTGDKINYIATATHNTGITYSLDAASLAGGNTIHATSGELDYASTWSGTTIVTATAAGCSGPTTATHTITITPTVGIPAFALGATSIRCQGANAVTYSATATTTTGITYTLNGPALTAGNTINATTGEVNYVAGWTGNTVITASAAGCNGPRTATHTVTITPTVGTPVFTLGASSTRCVGSGTSSYTATATNNTGISYSLDPASITGGNSINPATGIVIWAVNWVGSTVITASANGCNAPSTANHTVTINPVVTTPVFNAGASTIRCQGAAVITYGATANNTTGITYILDAVTDAFPGNSINSSTGAVTYSASWSGTSTITASAAGCSGPATAVHTVTITPTVGLPAFTGGATSVRCQGAGSVTYSATSTNNTGISYSLDAASITGGNSINTATGEVNFVATWFGSSIITVTATGCNGPRSSNHTVTTNGTVATPVFGLGAATTRCQGNNSLTYSATATNNTGITYSLDPLSLGGSNTINTTTGAVTWAAGWSGTSVITATATGCNGPATATHTVTITPTVGLPAFTLGTTSVRCQGANAVTYTANASTTTGITYSLNGAALTAGNTINATTGEVNYTAGWTGSTVITASAAGCNGPRTATHTVTITPTVGTPVFTLGASSTRCQGTAPVTYTATATNNTGISYSLDAITLGAGNTINTATGLVNYVAGWSGSSVITASATGCNGPVSANHTVTTTGTVGTPVFAQGSASTRCQGAGSVIYNANAINSTSITYSLDGASTSAGNTINAITGVVAYAAGWNGTSTITATAAGCNGPTTAVHTVTITATVGNPVFTAGPTSGRCQGAATITYTATATNNTGITYSLDAPSLAGGNTINAATGEVDFVSTWSGISTITASAMGCNGPVTSTHTVTLTSTVGVPIFVLGLHSVRTQGAATIVYSASATNSTGMTYSLDVSSLAGGNTINTATGAVTWAAGWSGTSSITAVATGCNGPSTSSHIVNANPLVVQMPLYLSIPGQILDRVDPVATNITTTETTDPITLAPVGVVVDATSTRTSLTGPITVPHTTGTGNARLMLVGISQKNRTITSVTYGGTALTLVGENNTNGNARISIYKMLNPPSGTADVVVNFSSNPDKGAVVSVTTFSGVNQSDPLGSFATFEDNAANPTLTLPSSPGELVYDVVSKKSNALTAGSGQTPLSNLYSGHEIYGGVSTKPGAVSVTMNWTAGSSDYAIGAVSIKPVARINSITFTQSPTLCNDLIIKAQTIQVVTHVNVTLGTMPVNPAITASLEYDSTTIISLSNPVYNSSSKILSWTGLLGADVSVPAGKAVKLKITTGLANVEFQVEYHSISKPSRISLLPVSTYIDFVSFDVYNAPYPGGTKRVSGNVSTTYYVRAKVTTPFGYKDITGLDLRIDPGGLMSQIACVDSTACTRTYEYAWTTYPTTGMYYLLATAKEGYENLIKNSEKIEFDVCSVCPPVALNDSATGAGGSPVIVNVLSNDYDPNNNIRLSTLAVHTQPNNGQAFISNNKLVYLPNGSFAGRDTLTYQICDSTNLCATAQVYVTISPFLVDPCAEATRSHVYYLPFAENEARMALDSSTNSPMPSNNIRTVISMKMPYPGMVIVWDEWEDGYETNALNPLQPTTKVWGDGNPYNGIVPGYASDIIPAGGSIVLDNTIPTNPRIPANIFYDGKDKIFSSGQITMTQVCGEPSIMQVQCMKTNVSAVSDYGTSFTIPVGQNFNSRDFRYTSLFIRASENNTTIEIDKDNNGSLETKDTLDEGEVMLVNGGVMSGATVTATAPIGIELHFGGNDGYSSRDVPIFPATWYSHTYYSPVPTTGRATNPSDTSVVMLYNSLSRPLVIDWSSGIPTSGSVTLPAKSVVRFPLGLTQTAAYKFVNPTGESFTAIQICDSYTPGGGGNGGTEFDWAFNLIAQNRLTDFATIAWAPGSIDGTRNDNPIWVTPTANTTIYVKYDGNINGTTGLLSPCGMRYDVSYTLNALNHKRLLDPTDRDQSGLAVFTCDGTKLAAVYGEDPSTAVLANPSWDVGSTIQPFCKQKLIFANDDYARTMVSQPVTIPILINDFWFLAVVDPTTVSTGGLLQPSNGTISINGNGTVIYTPNPGYLGKDTFEYNVCSTPSPVVCDKATVYIDISSCPAPSNQNVISGRVFLDKNDDGINNDGGTGVANTKVYLYADVNCNTVLEPNELKDSVTVDASGSYQFITYPEKVVEDDFDNATGASSCATGSDGNAAWLSNWVDAGDPSTGFCNSTQNQASTDCEIYKDATFSNAIRLKDNNVSATRTVNLSGASYAFLSFDYRRKSATLAAGEDVIVQASIDGSTFGTVFTIAGNGLTDSAYVHIYNQDITAYARPVTYIRFLTNNSVDDADTVYIDNVKIQFLSYPLCYTTQLNAATVPAYHHTTTPLIHNFTANSSASCLSPYDFGIAKNTVSITGTLYHDANGIVDMQVNGIPVGEISSRPLYAYLIDSTNRVVRRTTLHSTTGVYNFPNADVFTNYTLRLSTISVNLGDIPPPDAGISSIPGNWVNTGDAFGVNNNAGTGIKPGQATSSIAVTTSIFNITGVNFGVERLPDSDDRIVNYAYNTPDLLYDITGGLTGPDPEDGLLAAGKTYKITKLPVGAVLFYNNNSVTLNQVITSFNPALLKIDPDDDTHSANFRYAAQDAAGFFDPTPATIIVNWNITLPVKLISFSGRLNDPKVDLNWVTANELNTKHFEVQRSSDGSHFNFLAKVNAKGNSTTPTSYDLVDPFPLPGVNYYRLKIVDADGSFEYSRIVIIRIDNSMQLVTKVSPNPFTGKIDVYLTLTHNTIVDFRFIDIHGRMVFNKAMKGSRGFNWFTITDLEKLPSAPYMLHIVTDDAKIVEKLVKQ